MPTTAMSSPNIASVMPALRAEAVWLAIQYSQPLVTLTATYNNSFTKGLNAPSAIASLTLSQVRLSSVGSFARYFQKLLTSSTLRLSLISANTARSCGAASAYSIGLGRLIDFLLNFSRKGPHGPHPEEAALFARPSRRMAAGTISPVAVLRDARKNALLRTRLVDDIDMILNFENALLGLHIVESRNCGRLQTDEAAGSIT